MTHCYLGLGSNLNAPRRQLKQALVYLRKLPRSVIVRQSSAYLSHPFGVRSQPLYYNMVISIHTSLSALQLLRHLQLIETKCHRIRKKHWGARVIDIDILLYGEHVINHPRLIVPHPEMIHRDFVLVPLLEIAPTASMPTGSPLASCLAHCHRHLTD